jgi:transposase
LSFVKRKRLRLARRRVDINVQQLDEIADKATKELLSAAESELLKASIHAMADRLAPPPRTTEKAESLLNNLDGAAQSAEVSDSNAESHAPTNKEQTRPGHGRIPASEYARAATIPVPHETLTTKCSCPGCLKGKLYALKPRIHVRVLAMPPINARMYEAESLRCNLCGEIFNATLPPSAGGDEKYDATVASMIAQLKYGSGLPFNRIEALQKQLGIPLPATTQWDLVNKAAEAMRPVEAELVVQAAQGTVLHNDDTGVRILDEVVRPASQSEDRTGLYTTGIVTKIDDHEIALFISGPQHAGENMSDILAKRAEGLEPPLLMNDALASNNPKLAPGMEVIMANCLVHGRRKFADVYENFPEDCRHVIEQLGLVYWHDATARQQGLDRDQRLRFHQEHSEPVMVSLKKWMEDQLSEKKAEPNSGLGKAITYFLKRWDRLTLFVHIPGAPLDNNVAERALKKAVLHRKNSLFYKTQHGADVGDLFMSLIATCERNGINSFDYMTELQRHAAEVAADAAAWLPWNYHLQLRPAPD